MAKIKAGDAPGLFLATGAGGIAEGKTAAEARGLLGVGPALLGNVTVHVSTAGSDATGDGSAAKPFASVQKAVDAIPAWMNGYDATIQIVPGSYAENVLIRNKAGGSIVMQGSGAASAVTLGGLQVYNSSVGLALMTLKVIYNSALNYADLGGNYAKMVCVDAGARVHQNCPVEIDGGGIAYSILSVSRHSNWSISAANIPITIKNTRASDGNAIISTTGAAVALGDAVMQNYKTGIFSLYLGRVSYCTMAATSSYAGTTKILSAYGGRILTGGNADTTNYQY